MKCKRLSFYKGGITLKELATLTLNIEDTLAFLNLNAVKSLNAINSAMLDDLNEAMDLLEADPNVKVLVITGNGKAFMAGGDIKEMMDLSPEEADHFIAYGNQTMNRIMNLSLVTIAAVNGFALGGGLELALTCDIRIGTTANKIGFPEVGLGIIPGYGGTQRASRLIGIGQTKRLALSGEIIDGAEAHRIGLLEKIVEPDQLIEEATKFAKQIAKNAPIAIKQAKLSINFGSQSTLENGLKLEGEIVKGLFRTEDKYEGMNAFVEKRKAEFKGK